MQGKSPWLQLCGMEGRWMDNWFLIPSQLWWSFFYIRAVDKLKCCEYPVSWTHVLKILWTFSSLLKQKQKKNHLHFHCVRCLYCVKWYILCLCVQVAFQGFLPRLHDDIPCALWRVDRTAVAVHACFQWAVHGCLPAGSHHRKLYCKFHRIQIRSHMLIA